MYVKVVHYTLKMLFIFVAPVIFPSIFFAFHHLSLLLFPFYCYFPLFLWFFSPFLFFLSTLSFSFFPLSPYFIFFSSLLLLTLFSLITFLLVFFLLFFLSSFLLLFSFSSHLFLTSCQHKAKTWPNFINMWECKSK